MLTRHMPLVSSPSKRRVFFAVPAQDASRVNLVHAVRKAVRASGGRPVPPVDLHITLAFIGNVSEEQIALLQAAGASLSGAAFELTLDRLEHWSRPQILCAATSLDVRPAETLVRALRAAIARCDIKLDLHSWKAHVTVARNVLSPHLVGPIAPVIWPAVEFGLFESRNAPEVPRYHAIEAWPLRAG